MAKLVFQLQGAGWKVVATFEGNFPSRIKQLPLDRHFDINNVKRVQLPFCAILYKIMLLNWMLPNYSA